MQHTVRTQPSSAGRRRSRMILALVASMSLLTGPPAWAAKPQPPPPPVNAFGGAPATLPSTTAECDHASADPSYTYQPGSGRKNDPERQHREILQQLDLSTIGGDLFPSTFSLHYVYYDCAATGYAVTTPLDAAGASAGYGVVPQGCLIVGTNFTETVQVTKGKRTRTKLVSIEPSAATLAHELIHCWQYAILHSLGQTPPTEAHEKWVYKQWFEEGGAEWMAYALIGDSVPRTDWVFYDEWRTGAISESLFQNCPATPCGFGADEGYAAAGYFLERSEQVGTTRLVQAYKAAYRELATLDGGTVGPTFKPDAKILERFDALGTTDDVSSMSLAAATMRSVGGGMPVGYPLFGAGYVWPDQENSAGGSTTLPDPNTLMPSTTWGANDPGKVIVIPPGETEVIELGYPTKPIWSVKVSTGLATSRGDVVLVRSADPDEVDVHEVTPATPLDVLFGEDGAGCPNLHTADRLPTASPASISEPDVLVLSNPNADYFTVRVQWGEYELADWQAAECTPVWQVADVYSTSYLELSDGPVLQHLQQFTYNYNGAVDPPECSVTGQITSRYTDNATINEGRPCSFQTGTGVDWTLGAFDTSLRSGFDVPRGRHVHGIDWSHGGGTTPNGWDMRTVAITEYVGTTEASAFVLTIDSCPPAGMGAHLIWWVIEDGDTVASSQGNEPCVVGTRTIELAPTNGVEVYVNTAMYDVGTASDGGETFDWIVGVGLH